jgi:hypothetical protein
MDTVGHSDHGKSGPSNDKVVEVTSRVRELVASGADPGALRLTIVPSRSSGAANARVEGIELFSR